MMELKPETVTEANPKAGAGVGYICRLSETEFSLFRGLIYDECGISFTAEKRAFLESRLKRRMTELGIESPADYYNLVRRDGGRSSERATLLDILMICETSFFRNGPQFDLLRDIVLPEVVAKKERLGSRMIRLWSAGCSTGQEPYSALICLLECLPDPGSWTVRIVASDLSFTALERAQKGLYRVEQMKGVDSYYLDKYFDLEGGYYGIRWSVKRHVIFDYHNLKNDNGLRGLDIIFCRNVMIYFDQDEQQRLVSRFATSLVPGGFLFLGHAESIQGLSRRFTMTHRKKGIAYRLEG